MFTTIEQNSHSFTTQLRFVKGCLDKQLCAPSLNPLFETSEVSVGQHFYWQLGNYQVHGQVLITSWIVFGIIALLSLSANKNLKTTPDGLQNLTEYITEFIRDLAKTQIGEEEYLTWVPFLGTIFFYFCVKLVRSSCSVATFRITKRRIGCTYK